MKNDFLENQKYIKAEKRVKAIKGFYTHLTVYCIIISTIMYVNLTYEPHFHWFWFSLIGWGLGLFGHWLNVFGIRLLGLGKKWEENKIKQIMKENGKNR